MVFVPHRVLVILQEVPGSFFINSFQAVEDRNKFLLRLLPGRLSIPSPVLSCSHHTACAPAPGWSPPTGPSPGCQQTWYFCVCHTQRGVGSFTAAQVTHQVCLSPEQCWPHPDTYIISWFTYFISSSPNKSSLVISVVCSFTSLQITGFEGLMVVGRVLPL